MNTAPLRLRCHCGTIRQAARALTALYDAKLAHHGLRVTQFTIMAVINDSDGLSTGELARALVMDSTTLSRTLAKLRQQGLIRVVRRGSDLRVRNWSLTDKGRSKLNACKHDWEEAQERTTQLHGAKNQKHLDAKIYSLSRKLSEVLAHDQLR